MRSASALIIGSEDARVLDAEQCRAHGLLLTERCDPEEALALIDTICPDVVVSDIVFPGSSTYGPSFICTLRQRLDPFTSIIIVSRYAREEDREGARRAGADAYLIKPARPQDLLKKIRSALTLRRRGRRLPWNWRTGQLAALNTDLGRRHRLITAGDSSERRREAEAPGGRRKAHILLVEDDASLREMMVLLLETAGFAVVPMTDGGEALEYLKDGGPVSVVVLDLMMPRVDGWTFRRAQLADPAIADIPVIVVSAIAGTSTSELHAAATFEKPVDVAEVIGAVRRFAG